VSPESSEPDELDEDDVDRIGEQGGDRALQWPAEDEKGHQDSDGDDDEFARAQSRALSLARVMGTVPRASIDGRTSSHQPNST
jgi:hypothetical protein